MCVIDDRVLLKCQWLIVGLLVPAQTLIVVPEKIRSSCIVKKYIITRLVPQVKCRVWLGLDYS